MSIASTTHLHRPSQANPGHPLLFSHLNTLPHPDRREIELSHRSLKDTRMEHATCPWGPFDEMAHSIWTLLQPGEARDSIRSDREAHRLAAALRLSVICAGAIEQFPIHDGQGLDRDRYWGHSVATACIAFRLARLLGTASPELAFLAGLLHDAGKAAFDSTIPKSYRRVLNRVERTQRHDSEAEREFIGLDHGVFGAQLLRLWKLPTAVADAALFHDSPTQIGSMAEPQRIEQGIISLANALAYQSGIGLSAVVPMDVVDTLVRMIGIQPIHLTAAVADLPNAVHEVRKQFHGESSFTLEYFHRRARGVGQKTETDFRRPPSPDSSGALERWTKAVGRFTDGLRDGDTTLDVCVSLAEALEASVVDGGFVVWGVDPGGAIIHAAACTGSEIETRSLPIDYSRSDSHSATLANAAIARLWPGLFGESPPQVYDAIRENHRLGGILVATRRGRPHDTPWNLLAHLLTSALAEALAREESILQLHAQLDHRRREESEQGRLLRIRSLEVLSHLAAGAAHEMNNPLTVISGRAQLLLMNPTLDAAARKSIETIRSECLRCSGIISELMSVAKPEPPKPAAIPVHSLLENARAKSLVELGLRVDQIELRVADDRTAVFADSAQISTALESLIRNAVEAGTTDSVKVSINSHSHHADDPCVVVLRDNGRGMTPEALASALDPFFSERQAGRGRGLGLSRALRLVERNRGRLKIESSPGRGTKVVLSLPTKPWSA